jgi:hypothetical protein
LKKPAEVIPCSVHPTIRLHFMPQIINSSCNSVTFYIITPRLYCLGANCRLSMKRKIKQQTKIKYLNNNINNNKVTINEVKSVIF